MDDGTTEVESVGILVAATEVVAPGASWASAWIVRWIRGSRKVVHDSVWDRRLWDCFISPRQRKLILRGRVGRNQQDLSSRHEIQVSARALKLMTMLSAPAQYMLADCIKPGHSAENGWCSCASEPPQVDVYINLGNDFSGISAMVRARCASKGTTTFSRRFAPLHVCCIAISIV